MNRSLRAPTISRASRVLALVGALALAIGPAACGGEPAEPAPSDPPVTHSAEPSDPLVALLERVNADRRAAGRAPLEPHRDLVFLAQEAADEVTIRASTDGVDLGAGRFFAALGQRDYPAAQVFVASAAVPGAWQDALDVWSRRDPATFEGLESPELVHLGLGLGDVRGTPFYLVLGAATADLVLERRTATLREKPDAIRAAVLESVNRHREEARLPSLQKRSVLDVVAQRYADAMLAKGFYGHTGPDGSTVLDRVRAASYQPLRVGENIASGQTSAEQVMQGWMDSPEHRANILHPAFRELGVGVAAGEGPDGRYRVYWVQVFADPR